MSDSLLVEALSDASVVLDELDGEGEADAASVKLRARVEILKTASAAMELRPAPRNVVVHLAQIAMQVRDDAVELRRRQRSLQRVVHRMMD